MNKPMPIPTAASTLRTREIIARKPAVEPFPAGGKVSGIRPDMGAPQGAATAEGTRLDQRLARAKRAFTTRNVPLSDAAELEFSARPQAGDLVLAKVEALGHHWRIESPAGRRQTLYPHDEIIVAYGNRYATDQFDAVVPDDLGTCGLVAGGGVAAQARAKHRSARTPTRIRPIGLLKRADGTILNLGQYRTVEATAVAPGCSIILIVGTAMNAGKTTTAASLIQGLSRAGMKVGAAKITGTGSGGDIWSMIDAGARMALDFTDAGHASTAGTPIDQLLDDALALIGRASHGNDLAIIEIADGLLQEETAALLRAPRLQAVVNKIVLAAGDSMGAAFGHQWLTREGLPLAFIAGCVGSSPLGREETSVATGLQVVTLAELLDPETAPRLCFGEMSDFG